MSATVLYYPNVSLVAPRPANSSQDYDKTDINLLKTALLLWDAVEVIVPYDGFGARPFVNEEQRSQEKEIERAFEQVVRPRVVSQEEKLEVHEKVAALVRHGIPDWLQFQLRVDNFNMYPEKLDRKTWELLCNADVAKRHHGQQEYFGLDRSLGLVLMNLIADACAGKTQDKVTNYIDAHNACARVIAAQNSGKIENAQTLSGHKRLVSISLLGANVNAVPLAGLVKLREREKEDGFLPVLRRNYRKAVEDYIDRMRSVSKPRDIEHIEAQFKADIADDFSHLNKELQLRAAGVTLGSVAVGLLAATGVGVDPTLGGLFGLAASLPTFSLAREGALEKHKTAWLYCAASPVQPY